MADDAGGWSFGSIFDDIGDFWNKGLDAAEGAWDRWLDFDLKKTQVQAYQDVNSPPPIQYSPQPTSPFAGVSPEIMVMIAGAGIIGLILLRK